MFDIGFWELVVCGVVALIVFGPDKLPGLARTAGFWAGRLRAEIRKVRTQVEREMAVEDLHRAQREITQNILNPAKPAPTPAPSVTDPSKPQPTHEP